MNRKWMWLPALALLALWLFNWPGPGRAAGDLLQISFEPLVGDVDTLFTAVVKNFSWDDMALVQVTAFNSFDSESQPVSLAGDSLAVGPRRRANLDFTAEKSGFWTVRATGSWLSGGGVFAETTLPVATAGSTTGEIAVGQTVEGIIRPNEEGFSWGIWALPAQAGDEVALEIDWDRDGAGSAIVALVDRQGNTLIQDQEFIANITLQDDFYYIYVFRFGEEVPYKLTLMEGLSGDAEGGVIEFDTAVTGLIEPNDDADLWTFTGAPGDVAIITMHAPANSNLDSEIALLDANGNVIAANDNYSNRDSRLVYIIPAAGEYQIVAQSHNSNSNGVYRLRLTRGDSSEAGLLLRLHTPTQGMIPESGAQAWQFQGESGDQVTIIVNATDEGFDPLLILYGPDGDELGSDDDSGGNLDPSLTVTLPESGIYTASITSYDGSGGRYVIKVSKP